jgi:outer membrane biosynthesis protein TonB
MSKFFLLTVFCIFIFAADLYSQNSDCIKGDFPERFSKSETLAEAENRLCNEIRENPNLQAIQTVDVKTAFTRFASLKVSQLEIDPNPEPLKKSAHKNSPLPAPVKNKNSMPIVIITKPNASYTNAARQSSETGVIRLRMTLSANGSITKVGFLSILKDGLIRQTVFAAIRLKYIPAEKDGEAIAVSRIIDYSFSIY